MSTLSTIHCVHSRYLGHTFWDLATWQYPALAPLYPQLGASLLAYRERRLDAAKVFAQQTGHAGARFPWESAVRIGVLYCRMSGPLLHFAAATATHLKLTERN